MAHGSKQHQKYQAEPVYPLSLRHAFAAATAVTVAAAGGTFPVAGTKIPLSAAQTQKAMQPGAGTWTAAEILVRGDVSLDDTNDRILLEPGIYRVEVGIQLVEGGTDSDYHVALTTAAAAAVDVEYENIRGAVLLTGSGAYFGTVQYLTVLAARALELHVAWQTAGATGTIAKGSFMEVVRIGNVE